MAPGFLFSFLFVGGDLEGGRMRREGFGIKGDGKKEKRGFFFFFFFARVYCGMTSKAGERVWGLRKRE